MSKRGYWLFAPLLGVLFTFSSWSAPSLASAAGETGASLFAERCQICHSIGGGRVIGPDLAGVNARREPAWLIAFIRSPQALAQAGDPIALDLFAQFNQLPMPDQALSEAQIRQLLAYIQSRESALQVQAGGSAAAGTAPTPAGMPPAEPATSPSDAAMSALGAELFSGRQRLANGGPSCSACHHVESEAAISGGILATELTLVFSRMGRAGVSAILENSPFPVMQTGYADKALTPAEIQALIAFLQQANQQSAAARGPQPLAIGLRLLAAGTAGMALLAGVAALTGRRRKKRSVNQAIYDRQVKSE